MKNRIILIISLLILMASLIFNVTIKTIKKKDKTQAQKQQLNEDYGVTIVETGHMDEVEPGTRVSLAVPIENEKKRTDEDREVEKQHALENAMHEEKEDVSLYSFPAAEDLAERNNRNEEKALEILNNYYGEDVIADLFDRIRNETSDNRNNDWYEYMFPENGKELLDKMLLLIENNQISEEDKNAIKYMIKSMDLSTLDDEELKNRIDNVVK